MKKCWVGFVAGLVIAGAWAYPDDIHGRIMAGEKLSPEAVEKITAGLADDSGSIDDRIKLLGYYWRKRLRNPEMKSARQMQVLWLVEHAPDHPVHATPYCQLLAGLDGDAFRRGRDRWIEYAEASTSNAVRLGHAASYLLQSDSELAEKFLKKAQGMEPDKPEWSKRLGQVYSLRRKHNGGAEDHVLAKKELEQLEKAYAQESLLKKGYLNADLAKAAYAAGEYERAREIAEQMVNLPGADWNSGNSIHHGNMMLGLVVLEEGDIDAAKKHLVASGKTKGSPQLNSFGPNMTLAKALVEKGETEAVLEYLNLCRNFWKMDRGRLDEWAGLVKAGKVPDFGANLRY